MDPVWGAQLRSPVADCGSPDLRRLQVRGVGTGQASRSSHSTRYDTAGHPQPHLQTSTCMWVTADNSSCSGGRGVRSRGSPVAPDLGLKCHLQDRIGARWRDG